VSWFSTWAVLARLSAGLPRQSIESATSQKASKPMAIRSLEDQHIREIFKLRGDRHMDVSPYKAIVPEAISKSQFSSCYAIVIAASN
jgi:hypothetical protein